MKGDSQMAKKKSAASKKKKAAGGSREGLPEYVSLRTVLDAVEMASLRFFLSGGTDGERSDRARKLEKDLRVVLRQFEKRSAPAAKVALSRADGGDSESGCPDGYFLCNGCCVPYPCP
jgi:hypothetical protein